MQNSSTDYDGPAPEIVILEQPISRGYRFRYRCEGKTAGTVPGENTTNKRKTVPAIRINHVPPDCGVIVVISCVTAEEPYRPHPHRLVGKDCEKGVCTIKLKKTNSTSLQGIGIQCVKKNSIPESLALRQEIKVDPFQGGHFEEDYNFDAKKVRFAIQAFLENDNFQAIPPVVTNVIHDCKADSALSICRMDKSSSCAKGGEEVFLLCDKVHRDDITVQFYEEDQHSGHTEWEALADFSPNDVHKQFAIVFTTPSYKDQSIISNRKVWLRLYRPSDQATSEPKSFIYTPNDPDPYHTEVKRKRKMASMPQFIDSQKPTVIQNYTSESTRRKRPAATGVKTISNTETTPVMRPSASSALVPMSANDISPGTPRLEELMPSMAREVPKQAAFSSQIPEVVNQFEGMQPSTSFVPIIVPQQATASVIAQPTDHMTAAVAQPTDADNEPTAQYLLNTLMSNPLGNDMLVPADNDHIGITDYLLLSDIMAESNFATMTLVENMNHDDDDDLRCFSDLSKLQTDSGTIPKKVLASEAKSSDEQSAKGKKKTRKKVS